jgi:uncharacterized protein (UPF0332 family)
MPTGRIPRLRRAAQATIKEIERWKEGADLVRHHASAIHDIVLEAACDRWRLACKHHSGGNKLLQIEPPQYRSAISRFYYSMYHAMRACVYLFHEGDDHQEHSKLPQYIPADFPGTDWQQILKDARLARNIADYDPYPMMGRGGWKKQALDLRRRASQLIMESKTYLKSKGCKLP